MTRGGRRVLRRTNMERPLTQAEHELFQIQRNPTARRSALDHKPSTSSVPAEAAAQKAVHEGVFDDVAGLTSRCLSRLALAR